MIIINADDCIACGQCIEECKIGAIKIIKSKGPGYGIMQIDQDICVQCKRCLTIDCPGDAIKEIRGVIEELKKDIEQSVKSLLQEAIVIDGAHHKQWYLEQIASLLSVDLPEHENGIAP